MGPSNTIDGQSRTTIDPTTILLVDDEDSVRGICRSYLEETGFHVIEAENGLEALLAAAQRQQAIDLLITDLTMPQISGVELAQAFGKMWPDVKVLYMSGSPGEQVGCRLPLGGAFLKKPFAQAALAEAVSRVLADKRKA